MLALYYKIFIWLFLACFLVTMFWKRAWFIQGNRDKTACFLAGILMIVAMTGIAILEGIKSTPIWQHGLAVIVIGILSGALFSAAFSKDGKGG